MSRASTKFRLSRRRFLKVGAGTLAGTVLTACAPQIVERTVVVTGEPQVVEVTGEPQVVEVEGETVVVTATPPPPEPTTVKFLATAPTEYYRPDVFNEQHPWVDVDFEEIQGDAFDQIVLTAVAGGNPPELGWASGQGLWRFAQVGAAMEISSLIEASPHPEIADIDPKAVDQYGSPGFFQPGLVVMAPGQYGWPVYNTFWPLVYNKRLLEEAGVPVPAMDWTWDDWRSALQAVTKPDEGIWGFVLPAGGEASNFIHSALGSFGADVYDAQGKCALGAPAAVDALTYLQNLVTEDKTVIVQGALEGVDFLTGNVAFQFYGNFVVGWYEAALADPYSLVPVPVKDTQIMFDNVDGFMFLNGSPRPDAAWEYAKWLSSYEGQKVLNDADQVEVLSVNEKAAAEAYVNPNFSIPAEAQDWFLTMPFSDAARYRPWIPVGPGFNYDTAYDGIWLGDSVEATLEQIATNIDALNDSLPKFG